MNRTPQLSVIVLAAGKGTRMKSARAKVLHEVFYSPMVHHVLHAVLPLQPACTIVIVGHQREAVEQTLKPFPVITVYQEQQLGTGHAVAVAEDSISGDTQTVMILCGDTPLIRPETLREMYNGHKESGAVLTVMATILDNPTNYGRVISDHNGRVLGIVEEKDANAEQKGIGEINAGIYCVDRRFLFEALCQVGTDNSQGEMYLTDVVGIAVGKGMQVEKYICSSSRDVLGVNSRVELAEAHRELQYRRNVDLMLAGISIHSPESVAVSPNATVGRDSLLMSGVQVYGNSVIGENCILAPGVIIDNCTVGDNVEIGAYSVLKSCSVPANTTLPPHSTEV